MIITEGIAVICLSIREMVDKSYEFVPQLNSFVVYVAQDCTGIEFSS